MGIVLFYSGNQIEYPIYPKLNYQKGGTVNEVFFRGYSLDWIYNWRKCGVLDRSK